MKLPVVPSLVLRRTDRALIQAAVRDRADLLFLERRDDFLAHLASTAVPLAITEPRDQLNQPMAPAVEKIREQRPSIAMIGFCPKVSGASEDILALVKAGIDQLLMLDAHESRTAVLHALATAESQAIVRLAMQRIERVVPHAIHRVIYWCLQRAHAELTVEAVARGLEVNRRTLSSWSADAGVCPPEIIVGWCRLIHAAHQLEDRGRTIEYVAMELEFPSAPALRNLFRRYTGWPIASVRCPGGAVRVIDAFCEALTSGARVPRSLRETCEV